MINLLEGVPGSGKSYEAVVYHVLPALKAGRKVITNLPLRLEVFRTLFPDLVHLIDVRRSPMPIIGKWDAEAANRGEQAFIVGQFDAKPTGQTKDGLPCIPPPSDARLFASVWDFYTTWRGDDNIGPLYVIDECHVSFPKAKTRNKAIFTPDEVIQWFKISRHFGADVLLMTQRMGALDDDIAGLAEFHIRVRKAAFLGKPDHYVRKVFAGYKGGETSSDLREYEKQFFALYKSHTQGATVIEAQAQDVIPANLKWQRASRMFLVIGMLAMAWTGYKIFFAESKPVQPKGGMVAMKLNKSPSPAAETVPVVAAPPVQHAVYTPVVPAAAPAAPKGPDPLETRAVHMTGCMVKSSTGERVCTLTVSQNGMPIFNTTNVELEAYGYTFKHIGDCAAHLSWSGEPRAVICDAPSVGMRVANAR